MNDPVTYEKKYVQEFYDQIASHFDQTRYAPWPTTEKFMSQIPKNTKVLEVGCGNGKNLVFLMKRDENIEIHGCDLCQELCEIAQKKLGDQANIIQADQLDLPYKESEFQYTLSIAVIHHLASIERRQKAISELIRVTKPGGQIMIQVWALEQPEDSKRNFTDGDNIVPWQLKGTNKKVDRYCHVFKEGEIDDLVAEVGGCEIISSFYARGNWAIILKKL